MLAAFYMHNMSWGWGVLMMIGWLAFWAVIIGVAVSLWRERHARWEPTAREVLDRRLATGEISVEEYERRRRSMGAVSGPPATSH